MALTRFSGRFLSPLLLLGSIFSLYGPVAAQPGAGTEWKLRYGVNLCGAEFGDEVPGEYGRTHLYPSPQELDYYKAQGRTLVRLPFAWERVQPTLGGPLDKVETGRLVTFVRAAGARGMQVIVEPHNFGRYRRAGETPDKAECIGTARVPRSTFADLWSRLSSLLKDEPGLLGYGLMNEPHDMGDPTRWPLAAQAAIDAIRQRDKKTWIIVPGDNWSSARDWRKGSNEALDQKVRDGQNRLVFEAHCYFDRDLSGKYVKTYKAEGVDPNTGIEHVRPFVEWCQAKDVRGFVGEFGVPDSDTRWLLMMDRFLAYLQANRMGGAYWAGGPWWHDYALGIEPSPSPGGENAGGPPQGATAHKARPVDRPQMLVLRQYPG